MSRLTDEQRRKIREVFKTTGSVRQTARQTGISRNAVRRALRQRAFSLPHAPLCHHKASKLDPYKAKIGYLIREQGLSAVRVLEEITELGYPGGYSILKDYVRTIRPKPRRRPTPPLDHPPGQEGQMDWSPHAVILAGRRQIVHTASVVLCFSRWLFFRHFPDQSLENVVRVHEQAFQELGAVPEVMTYDNMTTVGRHIGPGEVWINPVFKRFAEHYDFKIVILPPGAKERHGKVERPFHYIENNFLAGREFLDLEELNRRADLWRANTANVRLHGTVRERPLDRLQREKPYLKPLPQHLSERVYKEVLRLIHTDFCLAIDTNRYSANPNLIGQHAKVRLYRQHLEIWVNQELDCKHTYLQGRYQRQVLPEHEKLYKKMTGQRRLLKDAFLRLGEPAQTYYEGLKKQRGAAAGYHLQRILQYTERYGADVLAGALAHASRYGAYSAEAVWRILQGKKLKESRRTLTEPIPENIRQWLRCCAVEKQAPDLYDKLIQKNDKDPQEQK